MNPIIQFSISNQNIKRIDNFDIVSNSIDYLTCQFSFETEDWDNIEEKFAIFKRADGMAIRLKLENNECIFPWEILAKRGFCYVSVYGGNRITTDFAEITVKQSGFIDDTQPPKPPSPDIYHEVLEKIKTIEEYLQEYPLENLQNNKVGYAEIDDEKHLKLYSDETKENLIFDEKIPSSDLDVQIDGESIIKNDVANIPSVKKILTDTEDIWTSEEKELARHKIDVPTKLSELENDEQFITEEDLTDIKEHLQVLDDEKMSYYMVTLKTVDHTYVFYHEDEALDFNALIDKFNDPKWFLYLVYTNLVFIPAFDVDSDNPILAFSSAWSYNDTPHISRVSINQYNEVHTDQFDLEKLENKVTGNINGRNIDTEHYPSVKSITDWVNNKIPTNLSQLTEDSTHRTVTDEEKSTWDNKSDFSGDYNDLTNKPIIPEPYDDSEIKEELNNKIDKPTETPVVGKVLKIKQVNEDGTFICEWSDDLDTGNVKINGVETEDNNIPIASIGKPGVIGIPGNSYGLYLDSTNNLRISSPSVTEIYQRNYNKPLVSLNIDYAVKTALTDGKGAEWTDSEKENAQARLGITPYDDTEIKSEIASANTKAEEAETIAKGRATGYVFDTKDDMDAWIEEHSDEINLGDNLYIRDTDVPDYWWDGTQVQELETQKVDLTEYKTKDVQVDGTSIVVDGVANIPIQKGNQFGVMKAGSGLKDAGWGYVAINPASKDSISARTVGIGNPIGTETYDYAVKCALCDGKGAEWTEEEKSSAQTRMGIIMPKVVKL